MSTPKKKFVKSSTLAFWAGTLPGIHFIFLDSTGYWATISAVFFAAGLVCRTLEQKK